MYAGSPTYRHLRRLGFRPDSVRYRCMQPYVLSAILMWIVFLLFLYGRSRSTPGTCMFNAAPYRQHLVKLEDRRLLKSVKYLESLSHTTKAHTTEANASVANTTTRPELCMVITTVDRHGVRYLLQSAASVLRGLSKSQMRKTELLIVNADLANATTPAYEADLELLRRIPHVSLHRRSEARTLEALPFTADEDPFLHWLAKERGDYVYGLNLCRQRRPDYILLFEDDVWGTHGWHERMMDHVEELDHEWSRRVSRRMKEDAKKAAKEEKEKEEKEEEEEDEDHNHDKEKKTKHHDDKDEDDDNHHNDKGDQGFGQHLAETFAAPKPFDARKGRQPKELDWGVLKLYMAEQYDGFDLYLNGDDTTFFIAWGLQWGLLAVCFYLAFLFLGYHYCRYRSGSGVGVGVRRGGASWRTVLGHEWDTLVCLWFILNIVPAAILFPVCMHKQNFFATRKEAGVHPTSARCCAQAQLFQAGPMFDAMISCINANDYRRSPLGVDLLVSDCMRGVGGVVYETIPHLFQHIGIHSSSLVKRNDQNYKSWLPHMSSYFDDDDDDDGDYYDSDK